jgi:hypothetical protein
MKITLGSSNPIQTIKTENMCYDEHDMRGDSQTSVTPLALLFALSL